MLKRDQTDDWREVTRQLRKYAHNTGVRDILVMDEQTAIYFEYPEAAHKETDPVAYLVAATNPAAGKGLSDMSMRELVVFVLLRALDRKGIQLCDSADEEASRIAVDNQPGYHDVLTDTPDRLLRADPSGNRKRPAPGTGGREQPKRGKTANTGTTYLHEAFGEQFDGWVVGHDVELEFLPDIAQVRGQSSEDWPKPESGTSWDSGFGGSSPSRHSRLRELHLVPITLSASGVPTTILRVERVLTNNVAVLRSPFGGIRVIGKHFGLHRDAPLWLAKELTAYDTCVMHQGDHIPYLYGVARVVQKSPFANVVLLTEFIEPGMEVAQLVHEAYCVYDTDDEADVARLGKLQMSATDAMNALHGRLVVHNDLAGRNLLVAGDGKEERVVLVDFDCSMVFEAETGRFLSRVEQDGEKLRATFMAKR